ncbi:MAG: superoxide dismutase family protein [Ruminococcaceae bacterium]|nr:superoxide dismutase family protein [Oscillospiraceae bacterium]
MYKENRLVHFMSVLRRRYDARATILGSPDYPDIYGVLWLYQTNYGVIVACEVTGLPYSKDKCKEHIFGLHIHEGMSCTGNDIDPFGDTLGHYNPYACQHPYHAGDLLPLFGAGGYAMSVFLTDRFDVNEVIGRAVIVHSSPDDFTTQPSGNSGKKIACGIIK